MKQWLGAVLVGLAAGVLGGCTRPDPRFRVDAVTELRGLEGAWVQETAPGADPNSATSLVITATDQPIDNGRLVQRAVDDDQLKRQLEAGRTRAYRVVMPLRLESGQTIDLVMRGYVLRGEPAFLCLQNDMESKDESSIASGLFALPATMFFAVSIEGDRLALRGVEPPIRLLTTARPLDEPAGGADGPAPAVDALLAGGKDDRPLVTTDPDRAVGVLHRYAGAPGFLSDKPVIYRRSK